MRVSCRPDEAPFPLAYLALPPPPSDLTLPLTPPLYFTPAPLTSPQVMKKKDLIRKNMVESVNNERNILALANNPFVVRVRCNAGLENNPRLPQGAASDGGGCTFRDKQGVPSFLSPPLILPVHEPQCVFCTADFVLMTHLFTSRHYGCAPPSLFRCASTTRSPLVRTCTS